MKLIHPFAVIGDGITSEPDAVSWSEDRLDVVAVETSGDLLHVILTNEGSEKGRLPALTAVPAGPPQLVSWGPGRLDVFIRDTDRNLQHSWYDGSWRPWKAIASAMVADPSVVSWAPGRLDIFTRTESGVLAHHWYPRELGIQGPEECGGPVAGRPGAATTSLYGVHMMVRGTDDGLLRYQYARPSQRSHEWTTTTWRPGRGAFHTSPPATPDGHSSLTCTSDPVMLHCRGKGRVENRLLVYARQDDRLLCLEPWGWQRQPRDRVLGDGVASDCAVASPRPCRADVFARLDSGAIGHLTEELGEAGAAARRWESLDDGHVAADGRPRVVAARRDRLDLFFRGTHGELCQGWWDAATGTWNAPSARIWGRTRG
ncbi:hypothetical protein [Streptosporangium sp. NPDC000396]|uniref:hypothetical protein n=1 Tax=Streptosporangium sp. NPDC000396 TaxID=3366185 RepID=UPI003676DC7A